MFQVSFNTDNAAFENLEEIPRILEVIASELREGYTDGVVVDYNGNSVGHWEKD